MMTPVIVANHITKWYGPRRAVDDVSFTVAAGEVMGLLGPNGSGKTTILRILTGYLRPTSGTANICGFDVVDQSREARRRIGYVPEDIPLYDWMRVREFLTFMARIKGLPAHAVPRAVDAAIDCVALGDVIRVPIGKLSRGFRQRVGIGQALLGDPAVLVLDEPSNGLDPRQIIDMRGLIRALARTRTLLLTSHILTEIEKVADSVAILLHGRLLAVRGLHEEGGGRRVRLRIAGDRDAVRACLEAVDGVRTVTVSEPDSATYLVDVDAPSTKQALVAAVIARRFTLLALGDDSADLETLFLEATR